jgi:hypothetical protein
MSDDTTGAERPQTAMDLDAAPVAARFAVASLAETPPPGVDENGLARMMAEDVAERAPADPGDRSPAALAESEPDAAG